MSTNKIAQLRSAKGISQSHLAKIMDVGTQTIANWENGRREPSIENLYRLSKFFETSIDYILCNGVNELEWYIPEATFAECMTDKPQCIDVPEAVVIIKALKRLDLEQRNKLLNICAVVFPDEFTDLMSAWNKVQSGGD